MRHRLGLVLTLVIWLFASAVTRAGVCDGAELFFLNQDATQEKAAWVSHVDAPFTQIGGDVADWFVHLSSNYELVDLRGSKSLHWQQPTVSFGIRDEDTQIDFAVNLVTNRHMLTRIETSSTDLLETLGVVLEELDTSAPKTWCVCADATCDSLRLERSPSGAFVARWTKGWD